jgi:putative polyhydroxyalkanoate system protein
MINRPEFKQSLIVGDAPMQNLTMSIPHRLTRAEARRRIEDGVAQLKRQYGGTLGNLDEHWTGDTMAFTLTVTGVTLSGHVYVEDQVVRLDMPLPWPLAMLAGGVKQQIEQQGRKLLGSS